MVLVLAWIGHQVIKEMGLSPGSVAFILGIGFLLFVIVVLAEG